MKTKLIAMVTAAAIASTGLVGATPAKAGPNEELARFLVGAVALGILVDAANRANARERVVVTRRVVTQPRRKVVRVYRNKPRQCQAQRWSPRYDAWVTFYRPNCMRRLGWKRDVGPWYKRVVVWR